MASSITSGSQWIRQFHRRPHHQYRLVCFPHAGGSASYYFPVSRMARPDIEVLALQYPGRQDRRHEKPVDDVGELADGVSGALLNWLDHPFAFFGHSMGAIVAFEVARRLQRMGHAPPVILFASARRAPSRHRHEDVHLRDDAGLIAELRRLGGTDPRVLADAELLATILPMTRSDYRAIETYRCLPGEPLSCPITVLVGDRDPQVTIAEASAWADQTTDRFELKVLPGGHFYLEQQAAAVMDIIHSAIASSSVQ
jgi:pyochelin biosynthesis protein PchC